MSKMTVIQLLNKIANGEEVPQTFIYKNLIFKLDETGRYIDNEGDYFSDSIRYDLENLNEKVIIIEENKKIKKLGHWVDVKTWVKGNDLETGLREQSNFNKNVFYKINEIIDKLNKEGNNNE